MIRRAHLAPLSAAIAVVALLAGLLAPGRAPAVARRVGSCPAGSGPWRVGAAKADITPVAWPVGEAAYSIGRMAIGAAHPFFARAIAIQSCGSGNTIVLTALDSQGYFAGYREDPGPGRAGFGTLAMRETVAEDTGLPVSHILIASTHTHNSPDSVGVWGGGSVENNKAPYLSRVKSQTVSAIESALENLRPAVLRVGTADISALQGTYSQVARDPKDYPVDTTLRVLQANDARDCSPIATLVNASVHADAAGEINGPHGEKDKGMIDPDWPGQVARDLERELPGDGAVVMAGAVGRTGPSFPAHTDPNGPPVREATAYGDVMARRVATALASSKPLDPGPIGVADLHLSEEVAEPALLPLFATERGIYDPTTGQTQLGGVMRSDVPPFATGTVLDAEVQTFRVGGLLLAGAPGEAYPEVQTELARRVKSGSSPFVFGLADDQLGYTPPAFEFPVVAAADGGDEGFFTINTHFGDDVINQHLAAAAQLGFPAQGGYDGVTAGPTVPPDQNTTYPSPPAPPEPREQPLSIACHGSASSSPASHGLGEHRHSRRPPAQGKRRRRATPRSRPCARPSGRVAGLWLGPVRLGWTRARARAAFRRFQARRANVDSFCLLGSGIRVGYPSGALLDSLTPSLRRMVAGRVVLALTANRYYGVDGVLVGERASRLRLGPPYLIGANRWYVKPGSVRDVVLKVRGGAVRELGVADRRLLRTRADAARFLRSFN